MSLLTVCACRESCHGAEFLNNNLYSFVKSRGQIYQKTDSDREFSLSEVQKILRWSLNCSMPPF